MEDSLIAAPPPELPRERERLSWLTPSRKILLWFVGWSVLYVVERVFLATRMPPQYDAIPAIVFMLGYGVLMLAWAKADSEERGEELSSGWKFMMVFLGFFSLCAYLFKTRGFLRGLLSILYAIGFGVGLLVFEVIISIPLMLLNVFLFGGKLPK
jgi:hypothetical protein